MQSTPDVAISQKLKFRGEDKSSIEFIGNNILYIGIYDGHNGAKAATLCADLMPMILKSLYTRGTSTITVLKNAFLQAHRSIQDESGTTASVILIHDKYITIAHVGDSRVVLCHKGTAVTITEDHRTDWENERCRLLEAEKLLSRQLIVGHRVDGLMVTRSIGDHRLTNEILPHPIINEFMWTREDEFMILATDGFWDVCDGDVAVKLVKEQKLATATDVADALVYYATQQYQLRHLRADDITCCIIDFRSIF